MILIIIGVGAIYINSSGWAVQKKRKLFAAALNSCGVKNTVITIRLIALGLVRPSLLASKLSHPLLSTRGVISR